MYVDTIKINEKGTQRVVLVIMLFNEMILKIGLPQELKGK